MKKKGRAQRILRAQLRQAKADIVEAESKLEYMRRMTPLDATRDEVVRRAAIIAALEKKIRLWTEFVKKFEGTEETKPE